MILTCCICNKPCDVHKQVYYYHLKKLEYTFLCSETCRSIRRQRIEASRSSQKKSERKRKEEAKKQERKIKKREFDRMIANPKNNPESDNIIIRNIERIIERRKAGASLRQLGELYQVSHESIRKILLPLKIKIKLKEYLCGHCGNKTKKGKKYCGQSCKNIAMYGDKPYSKFTFIKLTCDGCGETFERSNKHIGITKRNKLYNTPEKYCKKKNYCTRNCFLIHRKSKNVVSTNSQNH